MWAGCEGWISWWKLAWGSATLGWHLRFSFFYAGAFFQVQALGGKLSLTLANQSKFVTFLYVFTKNPNWDTRCGEYMDSLCFCMKTSDVTKEQWKASLAWSTGFFLSHVCSWNVFITYISLRLPSLIQFEKTLPSYLIANCVWLC